MIQLYIEERTGLRVLEVESLLDENIDPDLLRLLFHKGFTHTWNVLMSRFDENYGDLESCMANLDLSDLTGFQQHLNTHPGDVVAPITPPLEVTDVPYEILANKLHTTSNQLYATKGNPMELITSQAINSLFPPETTPSPIEIPGWVPAWPQEPYTPPQQEGQSQQPVLDESFWDYVASVNNLPPEQVL